MAKKPTAISDRIRAAIETAGVTRYRIAQDTGIEQSVLSRFVNGERGLSMEVIDLLGEYFNLELVERRKGKTK